MSPVRVRSIRASQTGKCQLSVLEHDENVSLGKEASRFHHTTSVSLCSIICKMRIMVMEPTTEGHYDLWFPNVFGTREWFGGRQFLHGREWGWEEDGSGGMHGMGSSGEQQLKLLPLTYHSPPAGWSVTWNLGTPDYVDYTMEFLFNLIYLSKALGVSPRM